ncbi:MAG: PIG-L family deacetylase [Saprospiraceae bacterium]
MNRYSALLGFLLISLSLSAQYRPTPPSSVVLHELQKLQDVSSVLYVAAHPDDENTRLIAHMANKELAETAYLSLTRGDGGQNLIGTDIREGLGVIRTQELLAARRTDGGTQFFSRANDFGYSKHPDETLNFWDRDTILSDMVWVIRKWQPDVIVTRFDPESAGKTHGHHTTSAMLAVDAFALAADPKAFPEQLREPGITTWQTKRIFFNTSWWFYGGREEFAAADKSDLVEVDAGDYYPLLGLSNGEIAARSRSNHSSQGFGSSSSRGGQKEYLKLLGGDMPADRKNVFDGIDDSWSRIKGGAAVKQVLAKAEKAYNPASPEAIVPDLVEALKLMQKLPANRYTRSKIPKLEQLIADCLGIYFETTSPDSVLGMGQEVSLSYEVIAREAKLPISLKSIEILGGETVELNKALIDNEDVEGKIEVAVKGYPSAPYWLRGEATEGMYSAPAYKLRGQGENPAAIESYATVEVMGQPIKLMAPVVYKRTYPDRGEIYRPVLMLPQNSARFESPVYLWADGEAREVSVLVEAFTGGSDFDVMLELPEGWTSNPSTQKVSLAAAGDKQTVTFMVTPGELADGTMHVWKKAANGAKSQMSAIKVLRYSHIPYQALPVGGEARAVRLDLKRSGEKIGYIMGAGDLVPEALSEIGYQVDMLTESDLVNRDLSSYDAIVVGIRAYNAVDWVKRQNDKLLAYAKIGGTVIVQYNTSRRINMDDYAPFSLKLSRKRVTVEGAPVEFVDANAKVLNQPNKITKADFDGWVQERGLYFPEEWDKAYEPILRMNDPGEDPQEGSLLVAKYGEGHYVYTGISFFRELPAGVPGAYRLFVNLLEL